MKRIIKGVVSILCTILVLPAIVLYRLQVWMGLGTRCFPGWSQLFSLLPGGTGVYLRNAFYRTSMDRCLEGVWIGFGTLFSGPGTSLGKSVYLGNYCSIGEVTIEDDVLIASHVSIMNGTRQHGTERLDCLIREQPGIYESVTIGENSWIGERATIAANVGKHCIIGAGSVVLKPIPDYSIAVGVPARVIRDRRQQTNLTLNSGKIGENSDLGPEVGSHEQALHILQTVSSLRTPTE